MGKNQALDRIKEYLEQRAKEDTVFAEMYKKEIKNINDCFAYIVGEARKLGNAVCMSDEEVYGMAVHYYCEDELEINPLPKNFLAKTSEKKSADVGEISEEEKARIREEAVEEYKKRCVVELEKKKEEDRLKKNEKQRSARSAQKRERETAGMGGLFDF